MRHCTQTELEQWLDNQLGWWSKIRCRLHLYKCPACRRALAACEDRRRFLLELKDGVRTMAKANTMAYKALSAALESGRQKGTEK